MKDSFGKACEVTLLPSRSTSSDERSLGKKVATRERNRIESLKIANEKERQALIEIASNPSKAFDYGRDNTWIATRKDASTYGFKKFTHIHRVPHQSVFVRTNGFNYQNISDDYITTEIELFPPIKPGAIKDKNMKEQIKKAFSGIFTNVEEYVKYPQFVVGKYSDEYKFFVHNKDINKTKIFGVNGFRGTLITENDYEYTIKDNYYAVINGVILRAGVRFKGDKDEVTFEQLEGRRYYLRKLVEQIISTQKFKDVKEL